MAGRATSISSSDDSVISTTSRLGGSPVDSRVRPRRRDEVLAEELAGREVDADPRPVARRAPARRRPAGLVDDPVGQRADQPARIRRSG